MSIILRIVSADGKKSVSKVLPALPSHIKVPPGAKVEVVNPETKQTTSLAQYVNAHSGKAGDDGKGSDGTAHVTIENTSTWAEAMDWLDSMGATDAPTPPGGWYDPGTIGDSHHGKVVGFEKDGLLIGAGVGAALIGGGVALSGGGGSSTPKDTIAPVAPSGLDLAAADDSGTSDSDNITNKTTELTVTGTAEAGAKVELFTGATSLGTATATAAGTFSIDITLAAGTHSLAALATDTAGNVSVLSTRMSVTVDTTGPDAPTNVDLDQPDDLGLSQFDRITSRSIGLTINGNGPASGTVELFDGTTSLGTVSTSSSGAFTKDVILEEGTHTITAKTSDTAGNSSAASNEVKIVVDTTPPNAPTGLDLDAADDNGALNNDNLTSQRDQLTISGTAEAGARVQLLDGTSIVGSAIASSSGLFIIDVNLTVGVHQITARATDVGGNIGTSSDTLTINVATSAASSSATVVAPLAETIVNHDYYTALGDSTGTLADTSHAGYPIA